MKTTKKVLYTRNDGSVVEPYSIDNPPPAISLDTLKSAILDIVYPVGSIYMSVKNVSPQSFLGGTWTSWGAGRVPVGVEIGNAPFSGAEMVGGESSVALTVINMPTHSHTIGAHSHSLPAHNHQLYTTNSYSTNANGLTRSGNMGGVAGVAANDGTQGFTEKDANNHTLVSSTSGTSGSATPSCGSTGGGTAHNNMQPYITCYMWKRTA